MIKMTEDYKINQFIGGRLLFNGMYWNWEFPKQISFLNRATFKTSEYKTNWNWLKVVVDQIFQLRLTDKEDKVRDALLPELKLNISIDECYSRCLMFIDYWNKKNN